MGRARSTKKGGESGSTHLLLPGGVAAVLLTVVYLLHSILCVSLSLSVRLSRSRSLCVSPSVSLCTVDQGGDD